ncbi:unnamed protein product [Miscanthus lutarioriparius]|uniref:Uncharacterized protein n=1 Tax=Miscanthus lutarioriparius TaxID=422564 RepID=A0A811QF96_9POAL|nr:unnamed protein product [Miscanthus lutarioriparius]
MDDDELQSNAQSVNIESDDEFDMNSEEDNNSDSLNIGEFTLKHKNGNGDSKEITVFDYFVKEHGTELQYSGDLPCINVGKPKWPTYFLVELKAGNGEDIFTCNGRWNFNNKRLIRASSVEKWAVMVEAPFDVIDENPSMRRSPTVTRVEDMFEQVKIKLPRAPKFLLAWHQLESTISIFTNVLLKINAKLSGMNSLLQIETSLAIPQVSKVPTIILGMDMSHGSPRHSDVPSIASGLPISK